MTCAGARGLLPACSARVRARARALPRSGLPRRSFGYSAMGEPALAAEFLPGKGGSHSALCALSVDGIEDWRLTTSTFSR